MITRTLLLLCLVVISLSFPLDSKQKLSTRRKRSMFGVWDPYYHKRSRYDLFSKYDYDWNNKLNTMELAFMFYDHGLPWEVAYNIGKQQTRHDLDHDGQLSRWEFLRSEDIAKPFFA